MNKMSIHHKKRVYLLFLCSLFGILSVYLIDAGRLFGFDFVEGVETVAEMDNLPQTLKDYEGYLDISVHELSLSEAGDLKLNVNGDKAYYFLPACARMEEMLFRFDEDMYDVVIDGVAVASGDMLAAYEPGRAYDMNIISKRQGVQEGMDTTLKR